MQEWNTELYQKKHSFVFEYGASLVDVARPQAGETILDIGCGTGELTNQLLNIATATTHRSEVTAAAETSTVSSSSNADDGNAKAETTTVPPYSNTENDDSTKAEITTDPVTRSSPGNDNAKAAETTLVPSSSITNNDTDKAVAETTSTTVVVGVDADPNMIMKAKEQFPLVKFVTVDIRSFMSEEYQGLMEEEKIPKSFDLIFSNAALHWIPSNDINDIIGTLAKLLKSNGGRFVVEFGGKGNLQTVITTCQDILREQYDIKDLKLPWYFPSISEFTTILERHGIEVVSAELYNRPTKLSDPVNGMMDWLRMFGQTFIEAAISAYDIKSTTTEGGAPSEIDTTISRHDKELLFLTAVNERLRSKLYDGTQWIADYRRIRIIGYRR